MKRDATRAQQSKTKTTESESDLLPGLDAVLKSWADEVFIPILVERCLRELERREEVARAQQQNTTTPVRTALTEQQQRYRSDAIQQAGGRWVTSREYSALFSLLQQTLDTWRYKDGLAGRSEALPGYPRYRRFGRSVRYWVPVSA